MEDIGSFADGDVFDGVLSNFGAVNCVQNLQALVADVAHRLAPGAPLLWVVMGRHAPWEWVWYLMRGQWAQSLAAAASRRRRMARSDHLISDTCPGQVAAAPYFEVNEGGSAWSRATAQLRGRMARSLALGRNYIDALGKVGPTLEPARLLVGSLHC